MPRDSCAAEQPRALSCFGRRVLEFGLCELGTISGVGEKKLETYGEAVLAVVAGAA